MSRHGEAAQDRRSALTQHLTELTRAPRTPKSTAHSRARRYIETCLVQEGFEVQEHPFDGPGFDGFNLFTRPVPETDDLPLLVMGAHYDSVTDSPGADDNASGVAALLALAVDVHAMRDQVKL